ncbi:MULTISPECIES: septum formation initiator family protein [unclassified Halanaerobium]|uniref:FtsB family cell division protein n=1 Tax=unclassified Halanaerobium TaxID=2641197 RepID=UPI000DF20EE3|nr:MULTISPECIES: septum formation initiator family protein [unclassified Halanaerobium]RCW41168.1 cell division protein FtsL [Halanaerobium sp. MA284_MarDTE_T2]RCW79604.1 cell division protein FtsL [Halanaerobium sp. DL-01]
MPRKTKDFILSPLFITIIAVILFMAGVQYYQNIKKMERLQNKIERLENNINEAKEENKKLAEELQNVDSDEYIEKIAREKLGLVKPGEVLVMPVENEDDENKDNKESKEDKN